MQGRKDTILSMQYGSKRVLDLQNLSLLLVTDNFVALQQNNFTLIQAIFSGLNLTKFQSQPI